jgi:DNA-binding response OmpR family regulator
MKKSIAIIDDDLETTSILCGLLEEEYRVYQAKDGWAGIDLVRDRDPDLVVLDLLLPGIDGWEVCQRIRHESGVPIIVLTTLGHEQHIIRALDLGADDYLTKPVQVGELKARIRVALRRAACLSAEESMLEIDSRLLLDRATHSVVVDGQPVELSATEYNLLTYMLEHPGRVLTHDELLTQIWGWDRVGQTNYLKVYVHRLRKIIEENPSEPGYILTERGLGYLFQLPNP